MLAELLTGRPHMLLDFDGPVCSGFGAMSGRRLAEELAAKLARAGAELGSDTVDDPIALLHRVRERAPELTEAAERTLRNLERAAVRDAKPTPAVGEMLAALNAGGYSVTVVSNSAQDSVEDFLRAQSLDHQVTGVVGRTRSNPYLLKPNPHLLRIAAAGLGVALSSCVVLGDSVTDIQAAHRAGTGAIAFVDQSEKELALRAAGPDALIYDLGEVIDAVGERH
jgi:HAD superfamily hydrolase (TIGR01662 family)